MARTTTRSKTIVVSLALIASMSAVGTTSAAPQTCFGAVPTIVAVPGETTRGTSGPDVIMGTAGSDVIRGMGGADSICARGGDDDVRGGRGADRLNLGSGNDLGHGGPGNDIVRGKSGRDELRGNGGRDELVGGAGADTLIGNRGRDHLDGGRGTDGCRGGAGQDSGHRCEASTSLTERLGDTFAGTGALSGYTTNNADALTGVGRDDGRYRALVTDNDQNQTLHFNEAQGRLDAKLVEFPFDVVVRNIGVGTPEDSQVAPPATGNPFVFAGVQVHVTDLDDPNSAHVVVGHRGGTHFTIEGKNTLNGDSSVNDAGAHVAPSGRADIRIVGNADRTLTVYWQTPGAGSATDSWTLYNGTGELPGPQAEFGNTAYIGLITYAFHSTGLPFVGTADAVEAY